MTPNITVFISYSHDSDEHRQQVLGLSERLREDGIPTLLDQYVNGAPPEGWPRWMLNQLDTADRVLVVCSATYYRRFRGHETQGGKGVTWEGALITQELYDGHSHNKKFLPVFLGNVATEHIPQPLRAVNHYALTSEAAYQQLLDALFDVAGVEPRPLGQLQPRQRAQGNVLRFDHAPPPPAPSADKPYDVLPHTLSPHFQDPNGYLGQLRQWLGEGGSVAVVQALSGMGGLGKTQLALKYSADYRGDYAGVWWLRSETLDALQIDAQRCCSELGIAVADGEPPTQALNRWLAQQPTRWLLVYDNADNPATLRGHLPQHGGHHILITSRNPNWKGLGQTLPLATWTDTQGAAFLQKRLGGDTSELAALSHDLGGLPLALEQAAGYLEETACSVAVYRQRLAHVDTEGAILDEGDVASGYELKVIATLTLAHAQLDPAAQQLLGLCAFAAPDSIPERWFRVAAEHLPEVLQAATRNDMAWDKVVATLRRYGLLERLHIPSLDRQSGTPADATEPALNLHRLTQAAARSRHATAAHAQAWLTVLVQACPAEANQPQHWPIYARLAPHSETLLRFLDSHTLPFGSVGWLLNEVANYLRVGPSLYALSQTLFEQGLLLCQARLGDNHLDTLATKSNLAETLWARGEPADARTLQEQVLTDRRRVLGEEHPDTLIAMSNLAKSIQVLGDLPGARSMNEQVWTKFRRVLGEEHHYTLFSMNNLAETLRTQGDLPSAKALQEQLLSIRRRAFGEEHPDTLIAMGNLAKTLKAQRELEGAQEMEEQVLSIQRRVLGEEHKQTLISANNLASTLFMQCDLAGARKLEEEVLSVQRRVLGNEHPDTLASMNNLANTLRTQGNLRDAQALQEQVLSVQSRVLGRDNPDTLVTINNLAGTLCALGNLPGARALQEQALTGHRRVLGEEHPGTLTYMGNLADTLRAQGDLPGARALQEQALTLRRKVLGEEHTDTQTFMNNLASTLRAQGDLSGARALHEHALILRRRALGEEHPDTLTSMNNLALTQWDMGEHTAAIAHMRVAAQGFLNVLGPEHPNTRTVQHTLQQMIAALKGRP